uniref:Glycoside hydrolase family 76 protein n=1 Tax=Acrobeloides nanus TaxID=290746 RepID=A0A914CGH1_9BILA
MHPLQLISNALLAIQSFNNAFFYQYAPDKAMYYLDTNHTVKMDFWKWAEALETLEDTYEVTQDSDLKSKISLLLNGFTDKYGSDWSWNNYNDDVMWASIASIRAFMITGNSSYFDLSKRGFDMAYARGWSLDLGGGLWWSTQNGSKNACVNGPAAIAAMHLYKVTNDTNYLYKAKFIIDWQRSKIYNFTTGEVFDHINKDGKVEGGALTYNQGTFIGACGLLHPYFPANNYSAIASKAMAYTKNIESNSHGLMPDESFCTDCEGFKQVLARWATKFLKAYPEYQSAYGPWLLYNAQQAWSVRNPTTGLIWEKWGKPTPNGYLNGHECANGPAMVSGVLLFTNGTNLM